MMQCVACNKSFLSPQRQGKETFCKCFWSWDTYSFLYETEMQKDTTINKNIVPFLSK